MNMREIHERTWERYRRLAMLRLNGVSVRDIAIQEGITRVRLYAILRKVWRICHNERAQGHVKALNVPLIQAMDNWERKYGKGW